jgi:hypothetical protein
MRGVRVTVRLVLLLLCLLSVIGILIYRPAMTASQAATSLESQSEGTAPVFLPLAHNDVPLRFVETFDGEPESPLAYRSPDWDITVHSRDVETWFELEPMQADHSSDCGPPTLTHTVTAYADTVFHCRNHVMTALNTSGYGLIYLTPNRLVDFSDGEAVIRWDMSTYRSSTRDWVDVWISPYDEHLQLTLQDWLPDLHGEPRRAVHVVMSDFDGGTVWKANIVRDYVATELPRNTWVGYEQFLTPDKARRDLFELRISRTHLRFGMPEYNVWWIDTSFADLGWTQGVVQFGHHSYNPAKDCDTCGPNTWHWDNIQIEPAQPFTIIPAEQEYATSAQSSVRFPSSAPAGAYLRFAGIGNQLEVSFDGGVSWVPARHQPQEKVVEEAFSSYFMEIPAGTSTVQFRGQAWWGGDWMVRSLSIWDR